MNNLLALYLFIQEHWNEIVMAWMELTAAAASLYLMAKAAIRATPSTVDDTFWNRWIVPVARFIHMDPSPEVDPIEELMMGRGMDRDKAAGRRRAMLRRLVDMVARHHGIDLAGLSDQEFTLLLDHIEDRAVAEPGFKGPIAGLIEWLLRNPDFVLAIIRLFMAMGRKDHDE